MAATKRYLVFKGKKLAIGCGVCTYADDEMKSAKSRCFQCLNGNGKKFVLDRKYANAKHGEHEIDEGKEYEEIMK